MKQTTLITWIACLLLGTTAAPARAQYDAVTRAPVDLELSFTITGRLAAVSVALGETVEAGQIVAQLDDSQQRAAVAAAKQAAESDVEIRLAQHKLKLAASQETRFHPRVPDTPGRRRDASRT